MKLFADTANVAEIRELAEWMVLDGVTTNPSLLAKEGKDPNEVFRAIADIVNGPISAEVVAMDAKTMVEEGRRLAAIHPNIMVKVPMTAEGLRAVRALSAEGKKTNVTLVFSSPQALLAARAGATYVSPFIGRLDDGGQVGMDLLREIRTIFDNYGYDTNVLAASVRHSLHVVDAAIAGVDAVTAPPAVLRGLVKHSLTDQGIERFLADWKKLGAKI